MTKLTVHQFKTVYNAIHYALDMLDCECEQHMPDKDSCTRCRLEKAAVILETI